MAGIPPFNGFLSKEMMLEEAAHTVLATAWLLGLLATAGALFSVAYSFRFLAHAFLGPKRDDYPHTPHDPGFGLWAAPAFLCLLVILIGLIPMTSAGWLVDVAASAVIGTPAEVAIYHWHGLKSPALWMSLAAIGGGFALLAAFRPLRAMWDATPAPRRRCIFDAIMEPLVAAARTVTQALHNGSLTRAIAIGTVSIGAAALWAFGGGLHLPGTREMLTIPPVGAIAWGLLMFAAIGAAVMHRNRLLSLILIGIIGLIISLGFAWLSAPDLALTQITVEVVTIVFMLLALNFLPKQTPRESSPPAALP
jgi:multicomponent K+:H+ antiporter subunit A